MVCRFRYDRSRFQETCRIPSWAHLLKSTTNNFKSPFMPMFPRHIIYPKEFFFACLPLLPNGKKQYVFLFTPVRFYCIYIFIHSYSRSFACPEFSFDFRRNFTHPPIHNFLVAVKIIIFSLITEIMNRSHIGIIIFWESFCIHLHPLC